MWSSEPSKIPRRAALIGLAALAGCGFTPVYGPGSTASQLREQVRISAPATAEGYRLLQALRDRLGRASSPTYDLTVTLDFTQIAAATTAAGSTTRYNLPGSANYVLTDRNGAVLAQGAVDSFTSYSATGTTVATSAAETDARDRLAIQLAELIIVQLSVIDLTP